MSGPMNGVSAQNTMVYDSVNERIVLAAAMADPEKRAVLVRTVSPDEMLVPEHSAMWRAMRVMVDRKLVYDPDVFRRLARDEKHDIDEAYIVGLEADAGVPENLDWHVGTLRWDATRARVLTGVLPELVTALKDPQASPESIAATARALMRSVEGGHGRKYIRRPEEVQRSYRAEIAARRASGNFYSFGYPAMDARLTEGSMPTKVAIVAGLPGSGKSTWSCDWAIQLAKIGRRVLYCPWEMGTESTLDVMTSSMTRIELKRLVQGHIDAAEEERIANVTQWITTRIKFMDNAFYDAALRKGGKRRTNDGALDLLESYIAESGCDVVFMDLWERMLADLSYDGVTQALYRQQAMAQEYRFFCVILQQLRLKDVERRPDKRPTRESIKGTGAFVEVADQVWGVHRDAQFKRVDDDSLEIINMKQRKGEPNWAVRFDWDATRSLITGGEDVPYDPGLEASAAFGDLDDVGEIKTGGGRRGGSKQRRGRDG